MTDTPFQFFRKQSTLGHWLYTDVIRKMIGAPTFCYYSILTLFKFILRSINVKAATTCVAPGDKCDVINVSIMCGCTTYDIGICSILIGCTRSDTVAPDF